MCLSSVIEVPLTFKSDLSTYCGVSLSLKSIYKYFLWSVCNYFLLSLIKSEECL